MKHTTEAKVIMLVCGLCKEILFISDILPCLAQISFLYSVPHPLEVKAVSSSSEYS